MSWYSHYTDKWKRGMGRAARTGMRMQEIYYYSPQLGSAPLPCPPAGRNEMLALEDVSQPLLLDLQLDQPLLEAGQVVQPLLLLLHHPVSQPPPRHWQ